MISTEVQRTLVKSPPELWSELSDEASLARHLSGFGSVRIVGRTAEERIDWEADRARGSVRIRPSGWGTRVTLTLERDHDAPADRPAAQAHGEPVAGPGTPGDAANDSPTVDGAAPTADGATAANDAAAKTEADSDEAAAGATQPDAGGEAAVTAAPADATAPARVAPRAPDVARAPERTVDADAATAPVATRESSAEPDLAGAGAAEATPEPNRDAKGDACELPVTAPSAETSAPASEVRVPRRRFFERVVSRWRHLITSPANQPEARDTVPGATPDPARDVRAPSVAANAETPVPSEHTASTKEPLARASTTQQPSAPAQTAAEPPVPASATPARSAPATAATPTPSTPAGTAQHETPAIAAATPPTPAARGAAELPPGIARTAKRSGDEHQTSPAKDIAAELRAAEEAPEGADTAVLTAVLDSLGAAHHRPFSRS